MDIYCPRCGEPYELFAFHEDFTPAERDDFRAGRGCSAGCKRSAPSPSMRASASAVLMELAGDDLDGVASDLDDFERMGLL